MMMMTTMFQGMQPATTEVKRQATDRNFYTLSMVIMMLLLMMMTMMMMMITIVDGSHCCRQPKLKKKQLFGVPALGEIFNSIQVFPTLRCWGC